MVTKGSRWLLLLFNCDVCCAIASMILTHRLVCVFFFSSLSPWNLDRFCRYVLFERSGWPRTAADGLRFTMQCPRKTSRSDSWFRASIQISLGLLAPNATPDRESSAAPFEHVCFCVCRIKLSEFIDKADYGGLTALHLAALRQPPHLCISAWV